MMITAKVSIDRPTETGELLGVSFISRHRCGHWDVSGSFIHSNQVQALAYAYVL